MHAAFAATPVRGSRASTQRACRIVAALDNGIYHLTRSSAITAVAGDVTYTGHFTQQ
jgi:hypothetical protein